MQTTMKYLTAAAVLMYCMLFMSISPVLGNDEQSDSLRGSIPEMLHPDIRSNWIEGENYYHTGDRSLEEAVEGAEYIFEGEPVEYKRVMNNGHGYDFLRIKVHKVFKGDLQAGTVLAAQKPHPGHRWGGATGRYLNRVDSGSVQIFAFYETIEPELMPAGDAWKTENEVVLDVLNWGCELNTEYKWTLGTDRKAGRVLATYCVGYSGYDGRVLAGHLSFSDLYEHLSKLTGESARDYTGIQLTRDTVKHHPFFREKLKEEEEEQKQQKKEDNGQGFSYPENERERALIEESLKSHMEAQGIHWAGPSGYTEHEAEYTMENFELKEDLRPHPYLQLTKAATP